MLPFRILLMLPLLTSCSLLFQSEEGFGNDDDRMDQFNSDAEVSVSDALPPIVSVPDAMSVVPDAMSVVPDAMPVLPDAMPVNLCGVFGDVESNGNFLRWSHEPGTSTVPVDGNGSCNLSAGSKIKSHSIALGDGEILIHLGKLKDRHSNFYVDFITAYNESVRLHHRRSDSGVLENKLSVRKPMEWECPNQDIKYTCMMERIGTGLQEPPDGAWLRLNTVLSQDRFSMQVQYEVLDQNKESLYLFDVLSIPVVDTMTPRIKISFVYTGNEEEPVRKIPSVECPD